MPHAIDRDQVDSAAHALALLARLNGVAADPDLLHARFCGDGASLSDVEMRQAAESLGMKSGLLRSSWQRLQTRTPLPVLGEHRDGHWFVIAALDEARVLLHDPLERRPLQVSRQAFIELWSGRLLLAVTKAPRAAGGQFGFGWFLAAMGKYRHLLVQVLIASCFLQLLALTTPLLFQVVMDKV
ncbi:MAG: type I secretion system permease/ATPase, partial [Gammaproteobacteria bacterium]|nr:type I secretion system permease/ATPase [Gammaproteobacteria bacterium]